LDAARGDDITYGRQSPFLVNAIPLSDPSNIIMNTNQTVKLPFLSEPEHSWCYYFAKAELAYQQNDLKKVIDLVDDARLFGYKPEDPFEWLTYIEAQALIGDMNFAKKLSNDVLKQDNGIRRGLCEVWKRVQTQSPAGSADDLRLNQILSDFQCSK